jgi:hypothetical protein
VHCSLVGQAGRDVSPVTALPSLRPAITNIRRWSCKNLPVFENLIYWVIGLLQNTALVQIVS